MIRETSKGKITEQELSEDLNIRLDNVDTHIADTNNPHAVSVGQIGAEPSGSVSTHNSAIDAHSDIRSELLSLSDDIPSDPLPREADTLEGHNASYYTTYSDTAVSNHNISGTAHSDIRSQLAQKASKTQEAWITPTLLNSWVAWDVDRTPKYFKDEFGFVHIRGSVKSGTISAAIFKFPAGYRPYAQQSFASKSGGSIFGSVDVLANGDVVAAVGNNTYLYLDGVFFKAEA